ncbi:hypothetical protein CGC56_09720 [Capnocytophaga canimorsus]|uniref:DUF1911 domain-containing protein n=1 Tax=Capnocytophaga canimorsus TaxID=28188 RepID=A0A250G4V4_9FLAO|nr:PoNi-like cognate immunity protein [Capnocytophaga canimorsus]ATA92410.1 hypothetical protein CGC56_09720 [Capnocytophaga canimorsus]
MMLRDKLKDEKYFKEYILLTEKRKSNYIQRIKELENPEQGYINSAITLDLFGRNLFLAKYSCGYSIDELKTEFTEVLKWFFIAYNSESFYVQMVWMLSIGTMLDIDENTFEKLKGLVEKDNPNDFLVDFLLSSKTDWQMKNTTFKFPEPYAALKEVIDLANDNQKEKATQRLKKYLDKEWYKGHSDTGWYNSHKSKHNIYTGYWSFESGALVKILGLDDTLLKDQKYYPYDMVHWKIS